MDSAGEATIENVAKHLVAYGPRPATGTDDGDGTRVEKRMNAGDIRRSIPIVDRFQQGRLWFNSKVT
jgi:hypothetical protein